MNFACHGKPDHPINESVAKLDLKLALQFIKRHKIVLTFPEKNDRYPLSLWSCFHPRKKMRWEWDSGGDHAVSDLWIFREALSRSGKTAYAKWYRGKATFIDREFLPTLLAANGIQELNQPLLKSLSPTAREIFELLQESSPLSTKDIKKATGLKGRDSEPDYNRAMKQLWSRLWIVGWGEKDDGAFPSLNIGATQHFFEKEWKLALSLDPLQSARQVIQELDPESSLGQFAKRSLEKSGKI